jgi:Flp pilus assembly protein TadG
VNRRLRHKPDRHGQPAGQALVEFALVAPILFLLLFAIIEGARLIYHYEVLNNATREGVRYAIVHGENSNDPATPEDVEDAVIDAAFALAGDDLGVTTVYDGPNGPGSTKRGSHVTVTLEFTYQPLMPLLPPVSIRTESNGVVNN